MHLKSPIHLAVALDGCGWHPAAWREADARPKDVFGAEYWTDLAREAEVGLVDFVTIEDGLSLQSTPFGRVDGRVDRVRGRLDAVLIASRVAPTTSYVGLVPAVTVTHTEPFHISKAIATLDYVSRGRAGVRVHISARAHEAAHFGRRQLGVPIGADLHAPQQPTVQSDVDELFEEATDYVEVVRRLWDSWEDDAEIRDAATGRFVDRDKLHPIDFAGRWFAVRGPSITPRPPQGQPIVAALAHRATPYRLVGTSADVGFVTPHDEADVASVVAEIRGGQHAAGRGTETVHVFADLVVFLDRRRELAEARRSRLDEVAGAEYTSDASVFTGTSEELADLAEAWQAKGLTGLRLRPATIPHDLEAITRRFVPELQRRRLFPLTYENTTLRARLGLPRPANRYAA